MTIKIEMTFTRPEDAAEAMLAIAGFDLSSLRKPLREIEPTNAGVAMSTTETATGAVAHVEFEVKAAETAQSVEIDTRLVGAPSDGNKRRNSAEKADDDVLEALAAGKGVSLEKLNEVIAVYGRARAKSELETADVRLVDKPAISTGEERIGPDDDPVDAAQDAADEAAETGDKLARIDVLRRLLGAYQKSHGMAAAVALCAEGGLIGKGINELDDAGVEDAIAKLSGETAGAPAKVEPAKTKADVVDALMRYADKYDGTRVQDEMKHTMVDCAAIFADVFGPDVTKLSLVPENGYGKAVAAIEFAIATDPFGRATSLDGRAK